MQDTPINWLENNVKYFGEGRAEFVNPKIILEGPVKIEFKESGESNIQMDFRKVSDNVETNTLELLVFVEQIESSQCTKLEVFTSNGTFSSIGDNIMHCIPNDLNSIKFFCPASQFEAYDKEAKYWVLPLYNFLTHFYKYPPKAANPLSINNKNIGITFKFNCSTCFIEPLEDYDIIKEELINFKNPKRITSMMIGELRDLPRDSESLDQQVPINFLELLGLATGTEVGSPWIEFRTADGELVKRIHQALNYPIYSEGHIAIDEFCGTGMSILLNNGQSLLHLGNSYMIATLKHLIRAGSRNLNTDEKLTHLFQALDGLCEAFNLNTQVLNRRINTSQQKQIKKILKKASQDILAISNAATDDGQSNAIREIANRTRSNPTGTARKFGLSLSDLLKLFDLADVNIIEKYYQASKNEKSWVDFISHCRGVEIHKGFLAFNGDEFDPKEISVITAHLHDILFRLVFKMLYYDGIYQSPIKPLPNPKESPIQPHPHPKVDWVNPSTSPKMLGYQ
ncbi:MAG TPA: hypothetical protein PLQ01_08870 [Methanothrix sp.]|nr:hypothetical protein [Methanothrix sp.]